jgi:hypothetical protein
MTDRREEKEIRGELCEKCQRHGKGGGGRGSISRVRRPDRPLGSGSRLGLPFQFPVAHAGAELGVSLLQTVADDGDFEGLVAKAIAVM